MKARHRPQRTCVACRETTDQRELIRLVHGDGGLAVDPTGRAPGRGAYLCRRPACWQRARETSEARGGGPLGHALRATLTDHDRAVLADHERTLAADPRNAAPAHAAATLSRTNEGESTPA